MLTIRQIATGRKSALMSVIGCRTDETDLGGVMEEVEGYENISVYSGLKQQVALTFTQCHLTNMFQISAR